jgi:hypothetical protein
MSSRRFVTIAGTVLLLGAAAPAHAALSMNALTSNALTYNALVANALTVNALAATGSAVADLNGVAVEGISLPQGPRR